MRVCWKAGKTRLEWNVPQAYWGKDWAKLLMNATLLAADCLPRAGVVKVDATDNPPAFKIHASGTHIRIAEDVEKSLRGEQNDGSLDARGIQPYLTHKLSRSVNAGLTITPGETSVELVAG